ncbi:GntR family transcriptional regulator [Oceanibium sediminis]|uniref:GntR family transcriptional regulator n=1 Tax=Oceanibium sediminis TaxID=2026339 RepID=UPI0018E5744B|nr:GntR family transcriptional regulator [Oceanibium sediminis]
MLDGQERTIVDRVMREIFSLLLSGEIPLGGQLNEVALAERFQVSRGPVREAVKQLQGRGLVLKEPYLKARVVSLSLPEVIEVFQLREAVEGMAVRLATTAMSDDELDEMLSSFDTTAASDSAIDLDLHVRIAEGCGNDRIRRLLCDELYYLLRLYRARSGNRPGRRGDAFAEHWQILRAMRARDAQLAESLMRAHIGRATRSLQDVLIAEQDNSSKG